MTEKLTRIRVPGYKGGNFGFFERDEKSRLEMVAAMRERADHLRAVVLAIDATKDEDFEVAVVRGVFVQKIIREVE